MRSRYANNRGAALVEFAIVVVLLVTLVFGIMEFGLLMKDYLTLNQAAREGVRAGALRADTATITDKVKTSAVTLDSSQINATVTYRTYSSGSWSAWSSTAPNPATGDDVQVRVQATYPHKLVTGAFFSWMVNGGDEITVSSNMVMKRE